MRPRNLSEKEQSALKELLTSWKAYCLWKFVLEPKDFHNLSSLTDKQIILLVKQSLSIPFLENISERRNQEKISTLFKKAIEVYKETRTSVYFEKKWVGARSLNTWLKSFSQVGDINEQLIIDFLRNKEKLYLKEKKEQKLRGDLTCFIALITKRISETLDLFEANETFREENLEQINLTIENKEIGEKERIWLLEQIELEEIIINSLKWPLNLVEDQRSNNTYLGKVPYPVWKDFIIYWRKKKFYSMILKGLWRQDEAFRVDDFWWLTVKIDSDKKEDLLNTVGYFLNIISSVDWEVKGQKSKIDLSDIDKTKLDDNLKKFVEELDNKKKRATNSKYKEVKMNINVGGYPIEIKFSLRSNENQEWLAFQWIYKYLHRYVLWKIAYLWESYITQNDLEFWAWDFLEQMENEIEKNPETRWKITSGELKTQIIDDLIEEELIKPNIKDNEVHSQILKIWLIKYFIKQWGLKKVKWKKDLYTTDRRKTLDENFWNLLWNKAA